MRFNNSRLLTPVVHLMSTHLRVNAEAPEGTPQVRLEAPIAVRRMKDRILHTELDITPSYFA